MSKSLFSLKKTEPTDLINSAVHTVNFESGVIEDGNIIDYFNSRARFLDACYQFAKESKLNKNQDFSGYSSVQADLKTWLENNQKASLATGAEFEVITTKIIESIKSITKNKYLTDLQKQFKKDGIEKEEDLLELTSENIEKSFTYELFGQIENILALLENWGNDLEFTVDYKKKIGETESNLQEFLEKAKNEVDEILKLTKQFIEEKNIEQKDLVESFITNFYFTFDSKIRNLESDYLPVINSQLNELKQQFCDSVKTPESSDVNFGLIRNLFGLDWSVKDSPNNFVKFYNKIINQQKLDDKEFDKIKTDSKKWFLAHPKSAPSFPTYKDKTLVWDKDNRISELFKDWQSGFDGLKFFDFLLARSKRIVEGGDAYRIFRHITDDKGNYTWKNWLEQIVFNKDLPDFGNYKKERVEESEKDKVKIISFVWEDGGETRFSRIVASLAKKKSTNEIIKTWLETHYKDLTKYNPEIALLRDLYKAGLLDEQFVQTWFGLLTDENRSQEKLAYRTEKRQEDLKATGSTPKLSISEISSLLSSKLHSLEKHLLLDKNWDEFKIFDKVSLKNYQKLAQVVFEACLDKKESAKQKSILARLSLETEKVLPIKISRMTASKPNAKSTLIYGLNSEDNDLSLSKNDLSVLIYPVNLTLVGGEQVKIVDTLEKASNEWQKGKYQKVAVGFLNGAGDNNASKEVVKVEKKDGTEGQYTKFGKWALADIGGKISIVDPYRQEGEAVGATNPAGYPKMFYFLIPKVCNNLIIPVKTSNYYLKKYTPFHYLQKYLELEKEYAKAKDEKLMEEILKLRCLLRFYYRLSSLELDLIQTLKLTKIDEEQKIIPQIKAKIHFQFTNPVKKYQLQGFDKKYFENILSVDLGEKHLACATLSKIDWEKWEREDFKNTLEIKWQTFLPASQNHFEEVENNKTKNMSEKSDFAKLLRGENVDKIAEDDKVFQKYQSIKKRYERQQRQYGTVQENLKNAKKNLTDQLAEQISTQITKLAKEQKALVVFENLNRNFGFDLKLYTQIRRSTVKKLGDIGLFDTSFVKSEADLDKIAIYNLDRGLFGLAAASWTSKTCSKCGYLPRMETKNRGGVALNPEKWEEEGVLEFVWNDKIILTIEAKSKENVVVKDYEGKNKNLEKTTYFGKSGDNVQQKNLLDGLEDILFTEGGKRKTGKAFEEKLSKFVIKNGDLLAPRPKQDTYKCPVCGNEQNADYQASFNIGLHFLVGLKLMEGREDKKGIQDGILAILKS